MAGKFYQDYELDLSLSIGGGKLASDGGSLLSFHCGSRHDARSLQVAILRTEASKKLEEKKMIWSSVDRMAMETYHMKSWATSRKGRETEHLKLGEIGAKILPELERAMLSRILEGNSGKRNMRGMGEGSNKAEVELPRMPLVATKGDGRVKGFLYRYDTSEVSMVCICHGNSFSPAEFVKHAGGTHIDHPLRHIVVIS